mgnify:CR=1 FL=1
MIRGCRRNIGRVHGFGSPDIAKLPKMLTGACAFFFAFGTKNSDFFTMCAHFIVFINFSTIQLLSLNCRTGSINLTLSMFSEFFQANFNDDIVRSYSDIF